MKTFEECIPKDKRYKNCFGEFIDTKLKELGHKQPWLAHELGVSTELINCYILGSRHPKTYTRIHAIKLALTLSDTEAKYFYSIVPAGLTTPNGKQERNSGKKNEPKPPRQPEDLPNWPVDVAVEEFYKDDINRLVRVFSAPHYDKLPEYFLYGELGSAKSKFAYAVARRLPEHVPVILHPIAHNTSSDNINNAINSLTEHLARFLKIPTTQPFKKLQADVAAWPSAYTLVLVGLRPTPGDKLADAFFAYLAKLGPNVKKLLTATEGIALPKGYKPNTLTKPTSSEDLRRIFKASSVQDMPEESTLVKLATTANGRFFTIQLIAKRLLQPSSKSLDTLLAEPLTLDQLISPIQGDPRRLIEALSLFSRDVDEFILARLLSTDEGSNDEKLGILNIAAEPLLQQGIIRLNGRRYEMPQPYRTYIANQLTTESELLKVWRRRLIDVYKNLRPKSEYVIWSSTTDYIPDKDIPFPYSNELDNIIEMVQLIALDFEGQSDEAIAQYRTAATLMSNFRAAFYASGRWQITTRLCKVILDKLEGSAGNGVYVAELHRQFARRQCYLDDFDNAKKRAEHALQLCHNGIHEVAGNDKETLQTLKIYKAICYRTYITLGEIALRHGQYEINCYSFLDGQRSRLTNSSDQNTEIQKATASINTIVQHYLETADTHFEEAKNCFLQAKAFAEAEFRAETLFADYYLAEARYYNRKTYRLWYSTIQVTSNIAAAQTLFTEVDDEWKKQHPTKKHHRLHNHITYYQGKISRRLASKPEEFKKALQKLNEALELAIADNDKVLQARVKFALGQLHISQARATVPNEEAALESRSQARKQIIEAAKELSQLNMIVETMDAVAVLLYPIQVGNQFRVETQDIPANLLAQFKRLYESAIRSASAAAEKQGMKSDAESIIKTIINQIPDSPAPPEPPANTSSESV